MAGAIVNKIWQAMGLNAQEDDEEYYDEEEIMDEEEQGQEENLGFFRRNKVVNMPQTQVKMVISQPTSFEQAEEICNYLKNRKSVIVNLE